MKVSLIAVGRSRAPFAEAIGEYEKRVGRYFSFQAVEVKEVPFRGQPIQQLLDEEGERLLARVPVHHELVALHRTGEAWSSEQLAGFLSERALRSAPGVGFLIGGAYGLSRGVLERADRQWSLGALTLPHELARLIATEQIYRAGTISRGEPYHKASQL
jgi:23S rRNA (pseudouridine1915-N3)-methyltransferase